MQWFVVSKNEMCLLRGGHLVHVDDASEDRFIVSLMHKNNCNVVWLGASDWSIEGVWVWEPHGPPMNYTHWAEGRPNNRGGENCLLIDGSLNTHHSYKWDDRGCGNLFCSVCEIILSPPDGVLVG
uniref:Perlucin-like n=1 Tax=Crassostrea virginica TaxID=6565 RepID=A0A8B8DLU1_CRAVI|nr:perlucin-like [Crassostrea virginica]XP_022330082.1 perlucin-like [Crassostrea virginica]